MGDKNVLLEGLVRDPGHTIPLLSGLSLKNRCMPLSVALSINCGQHFMAEDGMSLPLEICRQINEELLAIDISKLPPGSRAAEILMNSSRANENGYDMALWDIINIRAMTGHNLVSIEEGLITDPDSKDGVGIRFWPAGVTMVKARESWRRTKAYAAKFMRPGEWNFGHQATSGQLVAVINRRNGSSQTMHASSLEISRKISSFKEFTKLLANIFTYGGDQWEGRVLSRGSLKFLCQERCRTVYSLKNLQDAQQRIYEDQAKILAHSVSNESNPYFEFGYGSSSTRNRNASSSSVGGPPPSIDFHPPLPRDPAEDEHKRIAQVSGPSWEAAITYMATTREVTKNTDFSSLDSVVDALRRISAVAAAWEIQEREAPALMEYNDALPVGRMLAMLRFLAFGMRTTHGPEFDDIPIEIKKALHEGHLALLKAEMAEGTIVPYLGPREGYVGEVRPGIEEAHLQILTSYLERGLLWRCITFNCAGKGMEHFLDDYVDEGGTVAPLGTVDKLDDRKRPRVDQKTGVQKKRPVLDHTDGDHAHALNSGTRSAQVAKQLGTNDESIVSNIMKEENRNRGYILKLMKKDWSDAFGISALNPRSIGQQSSMCSDFLNINGANGFGSTTAPGIWEPVGCAPGESVMALEWVDPQTDGDVPPSCNRCTDDTLHPVAFRGNRQQRYAEGFRKLMQIWAGFTSVNAEKDAESGAFSNYQHGFGSLIDMVRRRMSTPFSRLCRVEDAVVSFIEDESRRLTAEEVPKIRGSMSSILNKAPALGSLVLPRLDAMLGDMARKFGERAPPTYEPNPALDGEQEDVAVALFRLGMEVCWRFVTMDQGAHMWRTFEQMLPSTYRDSFPGMEDPDSVVFFESDASGDGIGFFDPNRGVFLQVWLTPEEKAAFNAFEREDKGIHISNLEFLGPVWGIPMRALHYPWCKRAIARQDNQQVVSGINNETSANYRNLEAIIFLGLFQYFSGIDVEAVYVETEANVRADPLSRKAKQKEWQTQKKEWEKLHGQEVRELELPPELRQMTSWVASPTSMTIQDRKEDVYRKVLAWLEWVKKNRPLEGGLRIDINRAREELESALARKPIARLDREREDFPQKDGPSKARTLLNPIGGKAEVNTRASLEKKLNRGDITERKLRRQIGPQADSLDLQEVLNLLMQAESDKRDILWAWSEAYEEAWGNGQEEPPKHRELWSDLKQTVPLVNKIRVAEYFGGQMSLSKAARDTGGGELVAVAEKNLRFKEHARKEFPDALLFDENAEINARFIDWKGVEGIFGGADCQEHSPANRFGRGNRDINATGRSFEQCGLKASQPYHGLGVAFAIFECGVKVHQSMGVGSSGDPTPSAYDLLLENAPQFHDALRGHITKAGSVKSPITGQTPPLNQERAIVVLLNDNYFPQDARIVISQGVAPRTATEYMDTDKETSGRFIMPEEDLIDFKWGYRQGARRRVAFMGKIDDPPEGHGEGAFPTEAWSPKDGWAVTITNGGGKWALVEFNGKPCLSHVTNSEGARLYGLRGLPKEWLWPHSEFGRHVISHSIPQNVADAIVTALFELYMTPMSEEQSLLKGYGAKVSPRDVFFNKSEEAREDAMEKQAKSRNAAGPGEDTTPLSSTGKWQQKATRDRLERLKLLVHKQKRDEENRRQAIIKPPVTVDERVFTPPSSDIPTFAGKVRKTQKKTRRGAVISQATKDWLAVKVRQPIREDRAKKRAAKAQHYVDFCSLMALDPVVKDPTSVEANNQLKMWIAYEHFSLGNKGSTVQQKLASINRWHAERGHLEPFHYAMEANHFLEEIISTDKPPQGRLPVPMQLIDYYILTNDLEDFDTLTMATAMATGGGFCLRSKEYLGPDSGKIDPRATHWRDATFKIDHTPVTGKDVAKANRVTLSIVSNKNSLARCTRSVIEVDVEHNAVRLLKELYMRYITTTGSPPELRDPIFLKASKQPLRRKELSKLIQTLMGSMGVPSHLVGSHSLRRGGASMYLAAGVPEGEIKRFGRWTSDAYKLYLILDSTAMDKYAEKVARVQPRFELN